MLEYSKIVSIQNNKILINLKEFRFKDFVLNHKATIEQKIEQVFAKPLVIEIDNQNQQNQSQQGESDQANEKPDSQKSKRLNDIIGLFEGTVI